jgi:Secretion system C-terminal sorting domain
LALNLYEWNDVFVDLNDAGLAFDNLVSVAFGYYYYPSDLQNQTIYAPFNSGYQLTNNKRYLACVQTVNSNIYLGHDVKNDYTWNTAYYLQPLAPNESDGTYFALGFGSDLMPAMALSLCDQSTTMCYEGLQDNNNIIAKTYPNPTNNHVTFELNVDGIIDISAIDISGKEVLTKSVSLSSGKTTLDLSALETGIYIFKIQLENGNNTQIKIIKE